MSKSAILKINKPTFFPSISTDKNTWFWKDNIKADGLLISYDVLLNDPDFSGTTRNVKQVLGFDGFVIIDSGAFGLSEEDDPEVVFTTQKRLNPDIAILLDKIPSKDATESQQKKDIDITIKNAALISKQNNNKWLLMAVVQGNSEPLLNYCAQKLSNLKFRVIGIPLSQYSKYRQYESAILKVKNVKKHFDNKTIFHGLGCGSRSLIAILSHLGIRLFDSSAFYKAALHDEAVEPVTFCSINKPNSKKECKACLMTQRKPQSFKANVQHNLREILKEIQRCRCALQENRMKDYLLVRLEKASLKKIEHML